MTQENTIARAAGVQNAVQPQAKQSLNAIINSTIDKDGFRRRIDELMGARAPQFVSSIVSLVTASPQLQSAMINSPATVIQSALKAATYDLPIDQSLGMAYIVPFRNKGKNEAQFILGYRGLTQLALRTGAYKRLNVVDVRQGELKGFDRLTEKVTVEFVEDDAQRESLPIVGWLGYLELVNGFSKTVYWSVERIAAHERKHRKGSYRNPVWDSNPEAMQRKTVLRDLITHWGMVSIDYHTTKVNKDAADALVDSIQADDEAAIAVEDFDIAPAEGGDEA